MSTVRFRNWVLPACVAIACAAPAAGPARAEVGVVYEGPETGDPIPYVLGAILDEPDPVVSFWLREHLLPGPHSVLNPDGHAAGDGRPDIALHPGTRRPLVAWARNSPTGYDVVVARFENGAWTTPEVVADLADDALDPRIAIDAATGEVHLVYWVDATQPRVEHRAAPADLSSWSAPATVSDPGEAACRPQAAFHDGVLRIAYEVHVSGAGETPRQIVLARRDEGGFVPEIVAQTGHAGDLRPEVHSHAGRLWVDWIDADGEVAWTRFDDATGGWDPIRIETFATLEEREFHVRGAVRAKAIE